VHKRIEVKQDLVKANTRPPLCVAGTLQVEYASEFRYRSPILFAEDVVIAISQSGETADTLAALHLARSKGALYACMLNTWSDDLFRFSLFCEYLNLDYVRIPGICRVNKRKTLFEATGIREYLLNT